MASDFMSFWLLQGLWRPHEIAESQGTLWELVWTGPEGKRMRKLHDASLGAPPFSWPRQYFVPREGC